MSYNSSIHIGVFGKSGVGKSTLVMALTNQAISESSGVDDTESTSEFKSMEIDGIGDCVFIDTSGFKTGEEGFLQTHDILKRVDVALLVFSGELSDDDTLCAKELIKHKIPTIAVINKADLNTPSKEFIGQITELCGEAPIIVSANSNAGIDRLKDELISKVPERKNTDSITGELVSEGDVVLLVLPEDINAPKGKLCVQQVQTIRDLLDKKCITVDCTADKLKQTLSSLSLPPRLIISDSKDLNLVYNCKPQQSLLTSFDVLFAQHRGDIKYFVDSVKVLEKLKPTSKILIAEACNHVPVEEDISVKRISELLHEKYGKELSVTVVNGDDFPEDLTGYDLIIHCDACMFDKNYVLNRVLTAKNSKVPMTGYGVVTAYITGILDRLNY